MVSKPDGPTEAEAAMLETIRAMGHDWTLEHFRAANARCLAEVNEKQAAAGLPPFGSMQDYVRAMLKGLGLGWLLRPEGEEGEGY